MRSSLLLQSTLATLALIYAIVRVAQRLTDPDNPATLWWPYCMTAAWFAVAVGASFLLTFYVQRKIAHRHYKAYRRLIKKRRGID